MWTTFRNIVCLSLATMVWAVAVAGYPSCLSDNQTDCCPCVDPIGPCGQACPANLWKLTDTEYSDSCIVSPPTTISQSTQSSTSTTVATTTVPTTTTVTITTTNDTDTDNNTMTSAVTDMTKTTIGSTTVATVNVTVCLDVCPEGYYGNTDSGENVCYKCDSACISCNGSSSWNCTKCRFSYDDMCYSECPENTHLAENSTQCVDKPAASSSMSDKTVIIAVAAGVGGAVLIIAVVIIVICVVRRRRRPAQDGRRVISMLGEQRNPQMDKDSEKSDSSESVTSTIRRPPNYENTASVPVALGTQVQEQGDKIFRYIKDPTVKVSKQNEETEGDSRESGYYANDETVKRMRNFPSEQEKKEIAELPSAPKPPQHASTKGRKKTPLLPKSEKAPKRQIVRPEPILRETEGEDYIQMENPVQELAVDELYENTSPGAVDVGEEIYENQEAVRSEAEAVAMTPVKGQSKRAINNQPASSAENVELNDLEDYENVQKVLEGDNTDSPYMNVNFSSKESEW